MVKSLPKDEMVKKTAQQKNSPWSQTVIDNAQKTIFPIGKQLSSSLVPQAFMCRSLLPYYESKNQEYHFKMC